MNYTEENKGNGITVRTCADGSKQWYLNDQLHRADGPAVEWADGTKQWWLNGQRHRADGPAIEWANGTKQWWLNGQRHRADGPAIEGADGSKEWWLNDQLHRADGPAIERADGMKQWWLNGKRIEERIVMDAAFAARVAAMWASHDSDTEETHIEEDKLMLEVIKAAGYVKTAEAIEESWKNNEHWYA